MNRAVFITVENLRLSSHPDNNIDDNIWGKPRISKNYTRSLKQAIDTNHNLEDKKGCADFIICHGITWNNI